MHPQCNLGGSLPKRSNLHCPNRSATVREAHRSSERVVCRLCLKSRIVRRSTKSRCRWWTVCLHSVRCAKGGIQRRRTGRARFVRTLSVAGVAPLADQLLNDPVRIPWLLRKTTSKVIRSSERFKVAREWTYVDSLSGPKIPAIFLPLDSLIPPWSFCWMCHSQSSRFDPLHRRRLKRRAIGWSELSLNEILQLPVSMCL